MNLEKETWDVIDSYFKSTDDYIAKHHIDSYNDFIDNKLPLLFKEKYHEFVVRTGIPDDKKYIYRVDIYLGGRNGDKFYIGKPTIYDHETQKMRILYPNEARLKNLLYGCDLFFDLEVEYSLFDEESGTYIYKNKEPFSNHFMKKKFLTRIPIMLHSNLCSLKNIPEKVKQNLGEGKYDPGGYFIFDGNEKVLVCQEQRITNRLFLHKSQIKKISHYVEVKSASLDGLTSARTNRIQLENSGLFTVRMGQSDAFLEEKNGRDIPLFIVFRLLGIESDKEILEYILQDLDTKTATILFEMLRSSMNDPFILEYTVYDQESAIEYCENIHKKIISDRESKYSQIKRNKQLRLTLLFDVIYTNFLPHIGRDLKNKAVYLGLMTRKLLLFKCGLLEETNKDTFNNKRILLSGELLQISFRNALREFVRQMQINISTKYEFEPGEYSDENFANIINENNFDKLFDSSVFNTFFIKEMKKGNIVVGPRVTKNGIIRQLERLSFYDDMSHIRRVVDTVPDLTRCEISRRRLHGTQYGCICPVEAADGQNIGLQKGLSLLAQISFGTDAFKLIDNIKYMGIDILDEIKPYQINQKTKIFVNGCIIGITDKPNELVRLLRLLRRNNLSKFIDSKTSISYYYLEKNIIINCDSGRFLRPLYIIENNEFIIQPKHIQKIKTGEYDWFDLIHNKNVSREHRSIIDKLNLKNILNKTNTPNYKKMIDVLEENKCVIEYIDSEELSNSLLLTNININALEPHLQELKYTHCELHASMILSTSAFLIPFIQHTQAVRNTYGQKQSRKALGTYTTSFNNRFDTSGNILNYPDKPLITTRMAPIIHSDEIGSGSNIIIAITVYNGYNQEDAIIANKKSFEMGLFNSSLYKMYSDMEEFEPQQGQEELFYNPLQMNESDEINDITMKKEKNYQKLDEFGFIKKGSYLEKNDIVMGKYLKYTNDKGRIDYKDTSKEVKKDNEGSIVDKVFCWNINASKVKVAKVRTVQYRVPEVGDKLTNRTAQKGVVGIMLEPEDMPHTKDGIIPDLIVNPYAYASRMTVGALLEMLYGNLASEMGFFGIANPFEPINPETIGNILENIGLQRNGNTVLYEGFTGKMMDANIFMGTAYFQRLKQQVQDKINARGGGQRTEEGIPEPGGAYTVLTRQSVAGRSNGGGMRLGEMERDSLIAHGIWSFIRESCLDRCDKFVIYVSKKTKTATIVNPDSEFEQKVYFNPKEDGPVIYHLTEGEEEGYSNKQDIMGLDTLYQSDTDFYRLEIPYGLKLAMQELEGMGMSISITVNDIDIQLGQLIKSQKINSLKNDIKMSQEKDSFAKRLSSVENNPEKNIKEKINNKEKIINMKDGALDIPSNMVVASSKEMPIQPDAFTVIEKPTEYKKVIIDTSSMGAVGNPVMMGGGGGRVDDAQQFDFGGEDLEEVNLDEFNVV